MLGRFSDDVLLSEAPWLAKGRRELPLDVILFQFWLEAVLEHCFGFLLEIHPAPFAVAETSAEDMPTSSHWREANIHEFYPQSDVVMQIFVGLASRG